MSCLEGLERITVEYTALGRSTVNSLVPNAS